MPGAGAPEAWPSLAGKPPQHPTLNAFKDQSNVTRKRQPCQDAREAIRTHGGARSPFSGLSFFAREPQIYRLRRRAASLLKNLFLDNV